jgi:hypothetical protein
MSSDIIMGVMQAADTSKSQRAHARLAQLNTDKTGLFGKVLTALGSRTEKNVTSSAAQGGEDLIAQVMAAADPGKMQVAEARLVGLGGTQTASADTEAKRAAVKKLEGALLTAVVDEIVPKESSSLYGDGTAGSVARQFQVEGLAEAAAEAEPLGLANQFYGSGATAQKEPLVRDQQWPYFGRRNITPYAA